MRFSPLAVAKLVGLAAIIGLVALLIVWARATYEIDGRIHVDDQAIPANLEVRLMSITAEEDIAALTNELAAAQAALETQVVTQLAARVAADRGTDAPRIAAGAGDLGVDLNVSTRASAGASDEPGALTPQERQDVEARLQRYQTYAQYCRDQMTLCAVGRGYYEHGAAFWDHKIARLRDVGRVAAEEATHNYRTTWHDGVGLGQEPVQEVHWYSATNTFSEGRAAADKPAQQAKKHAPKKEGGIIAGSSITSNDVLTLADTVVTAMRQRVDESVARAESAMLAATLDRTETDEEGAFSFRGGSVEPGRYLIFSKLSVLSLDGERLEYMWFEPVTVPLKRLAFNKRTTVELTEQNTRRPAILEMRMPVRDEVCSRIMSTLRSTTR